MLKNKTIIFVLIALTLIGIYYIFFTSNTRPAEPVDATVYRQEMRAERTKKDEFFRTDTSSPILQKDAFKGLSYFDPDPAYRVTARLERFADKTQKLVVRMSDGSEEVYTKYAHAVFALNGQTCRLLVVKLGDTYSILFRDATAGKQTYGGGRYLELDSVQTTDNQTVVDFNTAYNPYCAYNPNYACPIPPAENTLPILIEAGERYH